jgi:hypothetical protein
MERAAGEVSDLTMRPFARVVVGILEAFMDFKFL